MLTIQKYSSMYNITLKFYQCNNYTYVQILFNNYHIFSQFTLNYNSIFDLFLQMLLINSLKMIATVFPT